MKKEAIVVKITIGIVCFLLTTIIFMQFRVVQEKEESNVDMMQETELRQAITNWKNKYEDTKQKTDEISNTLASYKEEKSNDSKMKETLLQELEDLELVLGKTDVEGDGIIITLSEKNQNELTEYEDVIPIKAEDLIFIINYLKDAGAEAISINDERIINSTDIVDVGGSIKINSKYVRTSTYVIKAIGNSSYLESSIFGKGGYAEILGTTGIKSEIQKNSKIRIAKYNGDFDIKFMEEVKAEK